MRMSRLFSQTRREAPAESDRTSYQLLVRAGYIQPLGSGVYALLPLGLRTLRRLNTLASRELEALDAQEVFLPPVQPTEIWADAVLNDARFDDPHGGEFRLARSYLPAMVELLRGQLRSYRQLPILLYHQPSRWDGAAPAFSGLLNSRNQVSLEVCGADASLEHLENQYETTRIGLGRALRALSINPLWIETDPVSQGASRAHAWFYPVQDGGQRALQCPGCAYAALESIARFRRPIPLAETPQPLEEIATPGCTTIDSLADFLNIPASRTAKAVFLVAVNRAVQPARETLVFAVVRGDRKLNETALLRHLGAQSLRPAADDEIRAVGAVPGYASPVGLDNVQVVVDSEIPLSPNLVSGANREGYHLKNVNFGRDYTAADVAEIAQAQSGDACPHCGGALDLREGVIIGRALLSSPEFTRLRGVQYLSEQGQTQTPSIGLYSLNLTRILACLAEEHHDERGLALPGAAAPYHVHLVVLPGKNNTAAEEAARQVIAELTAAGFELLIDDRSESAGVKFNDADLIGLPLRLTLSDRSLAAGGVEFKPRRKETGRTVPIEHLVEEVRDFLGRSGVPVNL